MTMKTRAVTDPISPARPTLTEMPMPIIDRVKPPRPSSTMVLRPWVSESRAHRPGVSVQNRADRAKAPAIRVSDSSKLRPMAGRTDCSAVLPAAAVMVATNNSMKARSRPSGTLNRRV
jgi:hypothetical protein